MVDYRDRRRRASAEKPETESELLEQMQQATYAGSADLVGSENEVYNKKLPARLDKEDEYGSFYDSIVADIRPLKGVLSRSILFNGTSFDRQRNNQNIVLFASALRDPPGQQYESPIVTNYNARGAHIIVNGLALDVVNDQLTMIVEGLEPADGNWYNILVSPLMSVANLYVFKIYPGFNPVVGFVANDLLPRNWRVTMRHNLNTSMTYSVSASLIL